MVIRGSMSRVIRAWRSLPRAFRVVAVVGLVIVPGQLTLVSGRWGSLASPAASTFAAAAIVYAISSRHPTNAAPWRWFAVFMVSTTIADHWLAADTWLWHRSAPVVSGPDVFYLGGLVALFLALRGVLRASNARGDVEAFLDMATAATVALFLAWQAVIVPTLGDASLSLRDRLVVVAYPVVDIVLLALLVRVMAGGLRAVSGVFIAAGLACWLITDTSFFVLSQLAVSGVWISAFLNAGWAAGNVWFALSALHPSMTALTQPSATPRARPLRTRRLVVAIAAFLVPAATEGAYHLVGRELNSLALLCASGVLGALIVVRATRLLRTRDAAEQLVGEREAYYRTVAMNSADATLILDEQGRVMDSVGSVASVVGYDGDLLGVSPWDVVHPDDQEQTRAAFEKAALRPDHVLQAEFRALHANGTWIWLSARIVNLNDKREVRGFVVNLQDVTGRKNAEDELTHQAFHDVLTQLPNRALFRDRLDHALQRAGRFASSVAVLFIDLDAFKNVNDSLGHDNGDQLLRIVAQRFADTIRANDTVARFGGDEFAVLVEDHEAAEDEAISIAERILQSLSDPIEIAGTHLTIRASIGVAIGTIGSDANKLLRDADIAMYHAKASGKGKFVQYRPNMQTSVVERLQIESELFGALERGELSLAYQPVIQLEGGAVTGFEALIRWQHPILGNIEPARFIPIAEDNGLIVPIGRWVLETACKTAADWHTRYPRPTPLTMAVNLSARELTSSDLVENVSRAIENAEIDPTTLVLEITESVLIDDPDSVAIRLGELRALGLRIAVDDFGTGYSSLTHLRQFPVDILKIDRSFVNTMKNNQEFPAILRGLLDLGSTLELETIAEGVELDYQRDQLRDLNCDLAQGFLFATPLAHDDAEQYLARLPTPIAATVSHRVAGPSITAR